MSQELKKAASKGHEKMVTSQEEQAKVSPVILHSLYINKDTFALVACELKISSNNV